MQITKKYLRINTTVANLYREPAFSSELISQAVLFERVEIIGRDKNWVKIMQSDGYSGWLHNFYTVEDANSFRDKLCIISARIATIYQAPDTQSQTLSQAVFGTKVPIQKNEGDWLKVRLPDDRPGWMEAQTPPSCFSCSSLVETAKDMLGVPYLWGGKTSLGFDCSGFVQNIFQYWGLSLPRDACQQFGVSGLKSIEIDGCEMGDLIFFRQADTIAHVGISLGNDEFIHCRGMVRIDSMDKSSTAVSGLLEKTEQIACSIADLIAESEHQNWNKISN